MNDWQPGWYVEGPDGRPARLDDDDPIVHMFKQLKSSSRKSPPDQPSAPARGRTARKRAKPRGRRGRRHR